LLVEGRKLELISERTYNNQNKKLEKWVEFNQNKLDAYGNIKPDRSTKKVRKLNSDVLLDEHQDDLERFKEIVNSNPYGG
jgi:hypothetical protein